TLASMAEAFGGARPAAVARELTKTYEEIRRGSLEELVAWAEEGEVLGEVVIVVAGAAPVQARAEDLVDGVLVRVAAGERLKTAGGGGRGTGRPGGSSGGRRKSGRSRRRGRPPGPRRAWVRASPTTGRGEGGDRKPPRAEPRGRRGPGTAAGVFVRRMRSLRLC